MGANGELKENTLEAFRRAFEDQADAVELDVRLTADGQLAIVHDATVPTGGSNTKKTKIRDLSMDELRCIEKDTITLEQALHFIITQSRKLVNIEIKNHHTEGQSFDKEQRVTYEVV